ncbi:hypothetical protein HGM15179_009156 [Zosterops borbonicus]|uniref:Uncharacterized protein n=1 Tax=Zosterops borbonicus TaxID=364589 RepID=A0A8K1GHZ9_9PASS|nr:hypothetical protein HGM15179_009156 [Zosterops borbonicus]
MSRIKASVLCLLCGYVSSLNNARLLPGVLEREKILCEFWFHWEVGGNFQELSCDTLQGPRHLERGHHLSPDGLAMDGLGIDGLGIDGLGMDGLGMDGLAMDGLGIDGLGMDGLGMDGLGMDGLGIDGLGIDGLAIAPHRMRTEQPRCEHPALARVGNLPKSELGFNMDLSVASPEFCTQWCMSSILIKPLDKNKVKREGKLFNANTVEDARSVEVWDKGSSSSTPVNIKGWRWWKAANCFEMMLMDKEIRVCNICKHSKVT